MWYSWLHRKKKCSGSYFTRIERLEYRGYDSSGIAINTEKAYNKNSKEDYPY